jgi:hypothetical protein
MFQLARQFFTHVIPHVMRPLRILWNEIIGFLFLCFGVWFSGATVRSFRNLDQPNGSLAWVFLSAFAAAVMLYYGVSSFLRARKIGRS